MTLLEELWGPPDCIENCCLSNRKQSNHSEILFHTTRKAAIKDRHQKMESNESSCTAGENKNGHFGKEFGNSSKS